MPNILNQDEIDSLLGAMERGEIDEAVGEDTGDLHIKDYNFRRPNLITKDQLRNFQAIHETFSREMVSALALFLRTGVEFNLVSTEQQQYGEFINSLSNVSHCVIFTADPLPGVAVIEINLSLIFGVIDMLLGGQGDIETEIRMPTEIEVSIVSPMVERILEKLKDCWSSIMEVNIHKERIESDPEYIQAAPPDAPVVVLAFDTKIGLINGIINICYPLPMIQAVNEYLADAAGQMDSYYGRKTDNNTRLQVMEAMLDVPVPVAASLGQSIIKGRSLMSLVPGDILVLNSSVDDPVSISVSGKEMFFGRVGKIKRTLNVKLTERIEKKKNNNNVVSIDLENDAKKSR
jgi:flagellar motor switch protein FliM